MNLRYVNRSLAFALGLLSASFQASAQNLVENGSFEASLSDPRNSVTTVNGQQITSWTIGGENKIMYVGTVMTASDGQRSVQLQFITPNHIEQTIPTVAGHHYRAYYDASAYVGPTGTGRRVMRGRATARTGETVIATQDFSYDGTDKSFPDVGWDEFTFDFTATGAETTLRWESLESGNNGGPSLDNVRVVPGHADEEGNWVIGGQPVFVTRLPATTQGVVGRPVSFAVEVLGDEPLSYQWYRVSNQLAYTPIAEATQSAYELASMSSSSAGLYAVVASNEFGSITNLTRLERVNPPNFSGTIQEQRVSVGQQLNLSVNSWSGSAPDRFQWFKDGVALEGETNSFFFRQEAELGDAGMYQLWVANIAGEATSAEVPVQVFEGPVPPWIAFNDLPPANNIQEGGYLSMNVGAAGGTPLSYFWYKDGTVFQSGPQNSFNKPSVQIADSGEYWVVISNSVATLESSHTMVTVYPPQEYPIFEGSTYVQKSVAEGEDFALSPVLTQGTLLSFQWFKRPINEFSGLGEAIPGANDLELAFTDVQFADEGHYTLQATNYNGQNQITYALTVIAKPIFSSPLQGFEGPAGANVSLNANIQNWSSSLTYQWYRDGELIPGATFSNHSFIAGPATIGSYTVVVSNQAGSSTSTPAQVVVREITPSAKEFHLVADYTLPAPERPGVNFTVVGDAHLRDNVVTFQSVIDHNDVGGLYRWIQGVPGKIVDVNDTMPSLSAAPVTYYDGLSAEDGGLAHFIALSTNSVGNQMSVFEYNHATGTVTPVVTQESEIPGKPGMRIKRFGYTTRENGKTAFFGMENATGSGGYRCVLVWDGNTLENWVNSDSPLPAGDGVWYGNSSQVGFDGSRLAFWAVDQTGGTGTRSGIFTSLNGAPLQKIAFTGDPIPGGLGTFKGFSSPPRVHDGKVLFMGQPESGGNYLMEYANGTLRVIAKPGDVPNGAGAIGTLQFGFDYLADGSILFTASGPGPKMGIYRWQNGALTENLTTLNSINGRVPRFLGLYDVDGMDCLITVSFDGSRWGLYTTAWGTVTAQPAISYSISPTALTMQWSGPGSLQVTTDWKTWTPVQEPSPVVVPFASGSSGYYRVVQP